MGFITTPIDDDDTRSTSSSSSSCPSIPSEVSYTTARSSVTDDEYDDDEFTNDIRIEFNSLLDDIKYDRIARAGRRLTHVEVVSNGNIPEEIIDEYKDNKGIINRTRIRSKRMKDIRYELSNDNGWVLQRDANGIRTLYQHNNESPNVHSLRVEGTIDSPMFDLLALLNEVGFYTQWLPTFKLLGLAQANKIVNPTPTQMLVHIKANIPWPFQNREAVFSVDGIDCMGSHDNPRQIVILLKTEVGSSYEPYASSNDIPQCDKGSVPCDIINNSGLTLTPIGNGRTFMQCILHLDPHLSYVPDWLIDLVARSFCFIMLEKVRSAVEIVKKPCYQERMRDPNNAFYMYIRKRIEEDMPEEMKYIPPLNESKNKSSSSSIKMVL